MEYLFIRAYSRFMGSYAHYTDMQVLEAQQDHAPYDSLYKKEKTGTWFTLQDLKQNAIDNHVAHNTVVTVETIARNMIDPCENMTITHGMFSDMQLPMITVAKDSCSPGHVGFMVYINHENIGSVEQNAATGAWEFSPVYTGEHEQALTDTCFDSTGETETDK